MASELFTSINPTSTYLIGYVVITFILEIAAARHDNRLRLAPLHLSAIACHHVRSLRFQPAHQERHQRVEDCCCRIRRQTTAWVRPSAYPSSQLKDTFAGVVEQNMSIFSDRTAKVAMK